MANMLLMEELVQPDRLESGPTWLPVILPFFPFRHSCFLLSSYSTPSCNSPSRHTFQLSIQHFSFLLSSYFLHFNFPFSISTFYCHHNPSCISPFHPAFQLYIVILHLAILLSIILLFFLLAFLIFPLLLSRTIRKKTKF